MALQLPLVLPALLSRGLPSSDPSANGTVDPSPPRYDLLPPPASMRTESSTPHTLTQPALTIPAADLEAGRGHASDLPCFSLPFLGLMSLLRPAIPSPLREQGRVAIQLNGSQENLSLIHI